MPIELPIGWTIALNIAGWPVIQLTLAWLFTRLPDRWFAHPGSCSWEHAGRFYERWFAIKSWKDHLPDAARWFSGGFSKGRLAGRSTDYLTHFARETWRGELCHWTAVACTPVFFLWNPLWADLVMVAYAVLANLPCILAQRYNRARLVNALQGKRPRRSTIPSPSR